MNLKALSLVLFLAFSHFMGFAQEREAWMTDTKITTILEEYMEAIEGEEGNWQVVFNERLIFILSDNENNRMRIFTPIIEEQDLRRGEMEQMLEANFFSALDAKYSMYEGFVISVFTHPLKELTEDQLLSAIGQVVNLADNFGTTYSSTIIKEKSPTDVEQVKRRVAEVPVKRS